VAEWLENMWDVEIIELKVDPITWAGEARLRLLDEARSQMTGLNEGEPIELLDAFCVIAVGRILRFEE
jgi:hypothetical protein